MTLPNEIVVGLVCIVNIFLVVVTVAIQLAVCVYGCKKSICIEVKATRAAGNVLLFYYQRTLMQEQK